MYASLIALTLAAFGQVTAKPPASPGLGGDCLLKHVDIIPEHDSIISAEVEGTLTKLSAKEGMHVTAGQLLAAIDERQAQVAVEVADLQHKAAIERANDLVEEKFARESAKYAKLDFDKDVSANKNSPGAVPDINIEQKRLAFTKANLQIEKAQKDRTIALKEADAKGGELKAAKIALARRTISAPFDGEIQQVIQKESQWVNPGDPVLRLVQFETLKVEGFVNAHDFDPLELANRRVTIAVHVARDRVVTAEGRVTFVSQTVLDNNYQVRAEFANQRNGQYWLIRPGLDAEMTIHLQEPPVVGEAQSAAILPK